MKEIKQLFSGEFFFLISIDSGKAFGWTSSIPSLHIDVKTYKTVLKREENEYFSTGK